MLPNFFFSFFSSPLSPPLPPLPPPLPSLPPLRSLPSLHLPSPPLFSLPRIVFAVFKQPLGAPANFDSLCLKCLPSFLLKTILTCLEDLI